MKANFEGKHIKHDRYKEKQPYNATQWDEICGVERNSEREQRRMDVN